MERITKRAKLSLQRFRRDDMTLEDGERSERPVTIDNKIKVKAKVHITTRTITETLKISESSSFGAAWVRESPVGHTN